MRPLKSTALELLGEFLATFILALVLLTSPIFAGGISPFVVAFAVIAIWYMFSDVTKVHMNPVVTIGEYLVVLLRQIADRKFYVADLVKFLSYIVVQLVAFFPAFGIAGWLRSQYASYYIEKNQYGLTDAVVKQVTESMPLSNSYLGNYTSLAFVLEMLIAFLVVFAVLKTLTSSKYKSYTGVVYGLMMFIAMIIAVQTTGASLNPWRSLVPALFEQGEALKDLGTYLLAPVVGAILAALVYALVGWLERPSTDKPVKSNSNSKSNGNGKNSKKKGKK